MAGLNLLVCDLTASTKAVTTVVPVKRTFGGVAGVNSGKENIVLLTSMSTLPTGISSNGACLDLWAI